MGFLPNALSEAGSLGNIRKYVFTVADLAKVCHSRKGRRWWKGHLYSYAHTCRPHVLTMTHINTVKHIFFNILIDIYT